MSKDAVRVIMAIVGFMVMLSLCDSGDSGNPYEYPENCIQGPFGYEC